MNPASYSLTGFVKSQEGENEEGSEGELVVRFGETLPKVIQEENVPGAEGCSSAGYCAAAAGLHRVQLQQVHPDCSHPDQGQRDQLRQCCQGT